jgi:hypothetical protein
VVTTWITGEQSDWFLLDRPEGNLGPRGEAQLPEDVLDVRRDRALGDDEVVGDLAVGEAAREQQRHLALARGQVGRMATRHRWLRLG